MTVNPIVTQANGIITIQIQCLFGSDAVTDPIDKIAIAAFGDPQVNIAGTFHDPNDPDFIFQFPTTQKYVGITSQLASQTARFMMALPGVLNPNQPTPIQGAMDCVTTDPGKAAAAWFAVIVDSIKSQMQALRQQPMVPIIAPVTV